MLADGTENIAGTGDVREIDLGLDLIGFGTRGTRGLRRRLRLPAGAAKMSPHLLGFVFFKRAGMRFLLGDSDFEQHIEDRLALNFQFSGQIVDSNLAHPPFPFLRSPAKSS